MRLEMDAGRYERIRELSPDSSKEDLTKPSVPPAPLASAPTASADR